MSRVSKLVIALAVLMLLNTLLLSGYVLYRYREHLAEGVSITELIKNLINKPDFVSKDVLVSENVPDPIAYNNPPGVEPNPQAEGSFGGFKGRAILVTIEKERFEYSTADRLALICLPGGPKPNFSFAWFDFNSLKESDFKDRSYFEERIQPGRVVSLIFRKSASGEQIVGGIAYGPCE